MKKILAALLILNINTAFANQNYIYKVQSTALNGTCVKNNDCQLASRHQAWVTNNTYNLKTVYVVYKICGENAGCKSDRYKIKVNHGTWHDGKTMKMLSKYHFAGSKKVYGETTLLDLDGKKILTTIQTIGLIDIYE